jgi:WD40 repeat protein
MHPNDVEILSGDDKGCFKIWDIASSKQRFSISNDNDSAEIISISVSRNGQNLIFGDQKGSIQPFCI